MAKTMKYIFGILISLILLTGFLCKDLLKATFSGSYEIEFEVSSEQGSHGVFLGNYTSQRERLRAANMIVVTSNEVIVSVTYPLNSPANIEVKSDYGFTRIQLVDAIYETYQRVYSEEEETSDISVIPIGERMEKIGLINRNTTNGKYRIWGHDLQDLVLEGAHVYKHEDGSVQVNLYVGS
ncbi:hypothetical protein SAMN02745866_03204 [Alteromonadaceae bacterium Bs31]|nr:hypothetical protein SAMN02745866_03204 [Alteromonadaceae bacterium Bs31]